MKHILLVDDAPFILEVFKRLLEYAIPDVCVVCADTGESGLQMFHDVDVVVSDYRMPGMNGIEFLVECKKIAPDVPRIMMTAFEEPALETEAKLRAGILAFVSKGDGPEALLDAVRAGIATPMHAAQPEFEVADAAGIHEGLNLGMHPI